MVTTLEEAKAKILEMQEYIEDLKKGAPEPYIVIKIDGDKALVANTMGGLKVVGIPRQLLGQVKPRVMVGVHEEQNVILTTMWPTGLTSGEITHVHGVFDDGTIEVAKSSGNAIVHDGGFKLTAGERVSLDPSGHVVIRTLGKQDKALFLTHDTNVTWDMIGGQDEAKEAMIEAIELPMKFGQLYGKYRQQRTKGILLYGPPGCGKTMLGKAAATAMGKLHGKAQGSFIYVKGPEILSKWVGESEQTIRTFFLNAREAQAKLGHPALIFIDEADAVLGRRGQRTAGGMEQTIVPMFLNEMDGLSDSGAIVVLATNRADTLDPAVIREGRCDRKVEVKRPDEKGATDIFKIHLADKPAKDDKAAMITAAVEFIFASRLKDKVSGALIAGTVQSAISHAIKRDINNGGKASGLTLEDMKQGLHRILTQNLIEEAA